MVKEQQRAKVELQEVLKVKYAVRQADGVWLGSCFLACVEFLEIKVHEVDYCLHLLFDLMKDFGILETLNHFDWH